MAGWGSQRCWCSRGIAGKPMMVGRAAPADVDSSSGALELREQPALLNTVERYTLHLQFSARFEVLRDQHSQQAGATHDSRHELTTSGRNVLQPLRPVPCYRTITTFAHNERVAQESCRSSHDSPPPFCRSESPSSLGNSLSPLISYSPKHPPRNVHAFRKQF